MLSGSSLISQILWFFLTPYDWWNDFLLMVASHKLSWCRFLFLYPEAEKDSLLSSGCQCNHSTSDPLHITDTRRDNFPFSLGVSKRGLWEQNGGVLAGGGGDMSWQYWVMCGQGGRGGVGGSGRGVGEGRQQAAWLTSTPAAIDSPGAHLDTTEQYSSSRKTHEARTAWLYWPTRFLANFKRISRASVFQFSL